MATVAQWKHSKVLAILEEHPTDAEMWDAANKILQIFGVPRQNY